MTRLDLALPPGQIYQDKKHRNYKRAFIGCTGSGKTTLALELVKKEPHPWKIIFDPEQQWADRLATPGNEPWAAERIDYMAAALAESGSVCFDPTTLFRSNKPAAAKWFCQWLFEFAGRFRGDKLVVLDDFPDYLPKNETLYFNHPICECVGAGRRRGIDFYFLCRNPTEIASNLRGQFSHIHAFGQAEKVQADNMAGFGFDPEQVINLTEGEYFLKDCQRPREIVRGKVRIPKQ